MERFMSVIFPGQEHCTHIIYQHSRWKDYAVLNDRLQVAERKTGICHGEEVKSSKKYDVFFLSKLSQRPPPSLTPRDQRISFHVRTVCSSSRFMCFGRIDDDRFFTREIQELEDFNAKTEADDEYQKKYFEHLR